MKSILFIFLLSSIPALLWLLFFLLKNQGEEENPKSWILWSFVSGMIGLLPVLGFSKIWQTFSGLDWVLWVEQFSSRGIFVGILSMTWLAMMEEYTKHRSVLALENQVEIVFYRISDGMFYSITAAIGFSFLENAVYLWTLFDNFSLFTRDFWTVYLFRGFGTMLGHIVFSGVFGYFWGAAIFVQRQKYPFFRNKESIMMTQFLKKFLFSSQKGKTKSRKLLETLSFFTIRSFIGRRKKINTDMLSPASLVAEGFLLATLLHTFFNFLVSFEWQGHYLSFLIVPFLSLGVLYLSQKMSGIQGPPMQKKIFKKRKVYASSPA